MELDGLVAQDCLKFETERQILSNLVLWWSEIHLDLNQTETKLQMSFDFDSI